MVNKDSDSKPSWLLDSGTSHLVTSDLANLTWAHDYSGNDKLVVANGKELTITHSGSASLPTSPSPLHLNNVLYVPDISKSSFYIPIMSKQLCIHWIFSMAFSCQGFERGDDPTTHKEWKQCVQDFLPTFSSSILSYPLSHLPLHLAQSLRAFRFSHPSSCT